MFDLIAAKGLGDALYLRALALHLIKKGEPITVFTGWQDVFSDLPITVNSLKERTGQEDIRHCQYCLHCRLPEVWKSSLFDMACRQAGVLESVDLRMDWTVRNRVLVNYIRSHTQGRRVMVFQPPKIGRTVSAEFVRYVDGCSEFLRVKVGHPGSVQECPELPCDLDLFGTTTVTDALDIGVVADVFFSEPSYLNTMAEALDKPHICLFSRAAATAPDARVRNLTPERFFHKPQLGTAIYGD